MKNRNFSAAALCFAALTAATALVGSSYADDDFERALTTPPADLSSATARSAYSPLDSLGGDLAPVVAPVEDVDDGLIHVRNAKVEIPKGEGYEVTISANGQGLLAELGLCELDANGDPILDADGSSKRQALRRGLVIRKGDVLGKQQDDELVQERIVAMQELLVSEKEAEKTLEIEVAEAAARVAQKSYQRAESLNKDMPGAVSPEEVQEKYYDWVRASKSIDKAKYDLEINQEKVKVAKARVNATDVQIRNRKFFSPIDGIVDDVFQNEGQWLREGDQILHIIRLDKVLVTGSIPADRYAPEAIDGKEIEVTVTRPGMEPQVLVGRVVYVRQVVESGQYYFYADVVNKMTSSGYWLLNPGALVNVTVR